MKKCAVIFFAAAAMAGCSSTGFIASGVNKYCSATNEIERSAFRERVNQKIAPNRVMIECNK